MKPCHSLKRKYAFRKELPKIPLAMVLEPNGSKWWFL